MRKWLVCFLVVLAACSGSGPGATGPVPTSTTAAAAPTSTTAIRASGSSGPSTSAPGPSSGSPATLGAAHPCLGTAPGPVRHVVVIVMENRAIGDVVGSRDAPYLAKLAAACGLATRYSGVAHPSLPNYIAMTSGSTHGITDDGSPASHPVGGPSIFSLLGSNWRSLEESMPKPCDTASGGEYAAKHNPAVYYTALAATCAAHDTAMVDAAPDLSAAYTFVTPNLCNDGHDCSTATADAWLGREVPLILGSPEYRSGGTVVFITWDENDSGGSLVPTYVVAPSVVPGTRVGVALDHYSLLRTSEELLGLTPLLGRAASATSMTGPFHL